MVDLSLAYVAHSTRSRVRLCVPGRRHDQAFFHNLRRRLSACDGISWVAINPAAASVAINHSLTFDWPSLHLSAFGLALADPENANALAGPPQREAGARAEARRAGPPPSSTSPDRTRHP
jgi:hypothetical protein